MAIPKKFGKYSILKQIAKGGMGSVYLAAAGGEGMEKLTALKVILPDLAGREFVERFRDEAKVVVRLNHTNLVQVFDAGQVDSEMYLAMEFVEGKDLRSIWNRCVEQRMAFPVDVVVQIVTDALRGLAYAHAYEGLDLVHRDVSPPNLMATYNGEVKITDFGLAKSALQSERTAPGVVFGKVPYMAPEQARGERVDKRADLYALAVVFWELITGRRLFPPTGDRALDMAEKARGPSVPGPSEVCDRVPKELDAVILKALEPDPENRYADASSMRGYLKELAGLFWPSMDTDRVSALMHTLYGDQIRRERNEREALLSQYRKSSGRTGVTPTPATDSETAPAGRPENVLAGKYRLGPLLGEGGMGQVFEAEHLDIGRKVALKILHKAYSRSPKALARFRREAKAASAVGHPSIVEITDFGETEDGRAFYVMELIRGASLADLLKTGAGLPAQRALSIGIQLCEGLSAAHKAGIVHRDLKPQNIMMVRRPDRPERVKLLDFGIARRLDPDPGDEDLTRPGAAVGTPQYMAPEQASGGQVDHRADLYSVSVLLYEMLTGRKPFTGRSAQDVLIQKLKKKPEDISRLRAGLDPELCETIMAGLKPDPDLRPRSAGQLKDVLKKALDRSPSVEPARVGVPEDATSQSQAAAQTLERKSPGRSAWLWGAGAVILIAAGVAVGLGLKDLKSGKKPARGERVTQAPDSNTSSRPEPVPVIRDGSTPMKPAPPPAVRNTPRIASRPARPVGRRPSAAKLVAQGRRLMGSGDYGAAKKLFLKARSMPSGRRKAQTALAELAFQQGQYKQAVRLALKAIKLGAGTRAKLTAANAYYRLKLYRSAALHYGSILAGRPGHRAAKAGLARCRRKMGIRTPPRP